MSALTHLHTILDNAAAGVFRSAARKKRGQELVGPPPAPDDPVQAGVVRLRSLIAAYLPVADAVAVNQAYEFAAAAHADQRRISGEPYIIHPLAVAETLAAWRLDAPTVIAGLLHDVVEDTVLSKDDLVARFGKVVAELVDGVSKLDRLEGQTYEEAQADNFRKMLLAMTRDVRVMLIKLADRRHNMQTLAAVRPEKQRRTARETLDIYGPIANRLGLNELYRELQDLSFQYIHPLRYRALARAVGKARGNRREVVGKILDTLRKALPEAGIEAEVSGREKHLFGIYRKMREKHLSFSQVLDIYGFRVVVKDRPTCYLALGALHGLYQPVPGKFKDYIAIPKANGYQSLHTSLIGPFGTPFEIQIRTKGMNRVAESGVASHWLYKDDKSLRDVHRTTHKWLQSLVELQSTAPSNAEFLEHVKFDLFPGEVFVFTPRGKILSLPRGATAVDFAYAVHTDVGNRCVACNINGEPAPLRSELRNGDRIEIITAPNARPNPAWLAYVRSGKARAQIRHALKASHSAESTELGQRMLARALEEIGCSAAQVDGAAWERLLHDTGVRQRSEIYAEIGLGLRLAPVVARRLMVRDEGLQREGRHAGSVAVRGNEGVAMQLALCCRPIPGDQIVGLIRKGQGLVIHQAECPSVIRLRGTRAEWVRVDWDVESGRLFEAGIQVVTRSTRGVLAQLAAAIAQAETNIVNVSMDEDGAATSSLYFTLQVADRTHLARILRALRRVPEVLRVHRYFEKR